MTNNQINHSPGPWTFHGMFEPTKDKMTYQVINGVIKQDAVLMAAAPDMLKALLALRKAFYVDGSSKALKAAFEMTHEIVKKAEGRI
jgi:hypothetical protein